MRIQHNIMAMNAYRNYTNNTSALSKNLEKLSSGYKINRAGDDAAGLAISEKMRAQITGLETAQKNAKDGISLVQTAEGALTEVHDMLNRMVELANQSANGTYDNSTDRANLQKEIQQLKSEIDRIADSSNFNGIKLLDGSLSAAYGVTTTTDVTETAAEVTNPVGTTDTNVDGELTAGTDGTKYSSSIYFGELTNTNASKKELQLTFNDASGTSKTVKIEINSGTTVTAADLADALNGGSVGGITITDANATLGNNNGTTKDGKFSDLYTASANGNVLTFTAKTQAGATITVGGSTETTVAKNKLGGVTLANNGMDAQDIKDANENILRDLADSGTGTPVAMFESAGKEVADAAKTEGKYTVASSVLTLTVGSTGKSLHNSVLKVGDTTYVLRSSGAKLEGDIFDASGNPKTGYKIVDVDDIDTAAQVAGKLAGAITADESKNGGYVAKDNADGTLTVSESTARAAKVLAGAVTAGEGADLIDLSKMTLKAATSTTSGTVKLNAAELRNGTTVTVGDKTYMLTNDDKMSVPGGATKVLFDRSATSEDIANALAKAIKADSANATNVSATGDTISFTLANAVTSKNVSALGAGLSLQIGDTSESFNQLNVAVQDMHSSTLGIGDVDISTQVGGQNAVDLIKNAINTVSSVRGTLGATQNRLDHTINNLAVMTENIQDAEATIRDTDVAKEMMAYTKNNILVQSAQAMLAQANQVPQGVLQLLG